MDPMDIIDHQRDGRETQRMHASREELLREEMVERIARAIPDDGVMQPLEGLYLGRSSVPLQKLHSVVKPSLCLIAQGSKEVLHGASRYRYDPSHYLLATLE